MRSLSLLALLTVHVVAPSSTTPYFRLTFAGAVLGNGAQRLVANGNVDATCGSVATNPERFIHYMPFAATLEFVSWGCDINNAATTFGIYSASAGTPLFTFQTTNAHIGYLSVGPQLFAAGAPLHVGWQGGAGSSPGYTTLHLWFSYLPPVGAFLFPLTWGGNMASPGQYLANGWADTLPAGPDFVWYRQYWVSPFNCSINSTSFNRVPAPAPYPDIEVGFKPTDGTSYKYVTLGLTGYTNEAAPLWTRRQGSYLIAGGVGGTPTPPQPGKSRITIFCQSPLPPAPNPNYFTVVFGGNIVTRVDQWLLLNGNPDSALTGTWSSTRNQLAVPWTDFAIERISYSIESQAGTSGGGFLFERGQNDWVTGFELNQRNDRMDFPPPQSFSLGMQVYEPPYFSPVPWTSQFVSVKWSPYGNPPTLCDQTPGKTQLLMVFRRL